MFAAFEEFAHKCALLMQGAHIVSVFEHLVFENGHFFYKKYQQTIYYHIFKTLA